ncbi:hypothetical protein GCM10020258_54160 [Sphingomonas yabuuchiae]
MFQAGKVGFALAAASAVGYTTFVVNIATDLPAQIIAAGSGTPVTNPGTTFDTYVADTGKLGQRMVDANTKVQAQASRGLTDFRTPLIQLTCSWSPICIAILYVFAFLSASIGFCIVIFATLSVSICVALAPLALACLLFNSSRWLFDGWLKQTTNFVLLMVIMAIMTKFITGLQEAAMDGILGSIGDGTIFVTTENTYLTLSAGVMVVATISCSAIYIVGSIFFFSPRHRLGDRRRRLVQRPWLSDDGCEHDGQSPDVPARDPGCHSSQSGGERRFDQSRGMTIAMSIVQIGSRPLDPASPALEIV